MKRNQLKPENNIWIETEIWFEPKNSNLFNRNLVWKDFHHHTPLGTWKSIRNPIQRRKKSHQSITQNGKFKIILIHDQNLKIPFKICTKLYLNPKIPIELYSDNNFQRQAPTETCIFQMKYILNPTFRVICAKTKSATMFIIYTGIRRLMKIRVLLLEKGLLGELGIIQHSRTPVGRLIAKWKLE